MLRSVFAVLAVALVLGLAAGPSDAARLPLDALVRAVDLPDTPEFQREDGKYVDLGYRHQVWGEGQWIGYIDSDTYLKLSAEQVAMLLLVAGIDQLPPVPAVPVSIRLVQGLFIVGIFGFLLSLWKRLTRPRRQSDAYLAQTLEADLAEMERVRTIEDAEPRINQRQAQMQAQVRASVAAGPARKTFGRRVA